MTATSRKTGHLLTVPMHHVKDTKGTFVYASNEDDSPITQLYIRKNGSGWPTPPTTITVTVSA